MSRSELPVGERKRTGLIVVGLALLVLIAGLVKLQIFEHRELVEKSENNRIRVAPIIPRRGRVYDRERRVIIENRPSYTVSVIPVEIVPGQTLPQLSRLLGMDTLTIRKRIRKNTVNRYQQAPVKRDVSFETIAVLEEQSNLFPGVTYQMERVRKYESSLQAECFTGYVGEVSEEELGDEEKPEYRLGSMIGKKGLEKYYDYLLRGYEGTKYTEVTASGQMKGQSRERSPVPAIAGADLYLTIDNDLQVAGARALDTFCCGAIVAIDPRDGGILALVSYPGYDANIFSSVIPESLWQQITQDSSHPLLNRPLSGLYPPGSTTKFVTLGAGLEEGIINYNSTFQPCPGGFQFGNRYFKCWNPAGHGSTNSVTAIEQSCDVYFYQLGIKLGIDQLSRYYGLCGFGRPTGIDLPTEAAGLNPNSEYYDRRYGKGKWSRGLVLNNAIGQGELLSTILQLTQFFCGLATGGVVYRPHLIGSVSRPNGEHLKTERAVSFHLPFSKRTSEILTEALRLVVEGPNGTARILKNDLYTVGGKTGTVQNPHGENHSWFVGLAPLENPEIVVAAIIENAGHGSEVAAPLVGRILDSYFEKKFPSDTTVSTKSGKDSYFEKNSPPDTAVSSNKGTD